MRNVSKTSGCWPKGNRSIVCRRLDEAQVLTDSHFLKQILYALLANALKHGEGDVVVRLCRRQHNARFLLVNRLRQGSIPAPKHPTLGLGLRLVGALLTLQPSLHLRRRVTRAHHAVMLSIPCRTPENYVHSGEGI